MVDFKDLVTPTTERASSVGKEVTFNDSALPKSLCKDCKS